MKSLQKIGGSDRKDNTSTILNKLFSCEIISEKKPEKQRQVICLLKDPSEIPFLSLLFFETMWVVVSEKQETIFVFAFVFFLN